jgi:transposase
LPAARHGYCWAHLGRDFLAGARRSEPFAFLGCSCREAVDALFAAWRRFRDGALDRPGLAATLAPVQQRLRTWLPWGAAGGKKLAGFCRNLLEHWESLWVCVTTAGVEPTNNRSERLLRPGVRGRKTS